MQLINYVDLFVSAIINMLLCVYIIKKVFNLNYIDNKLEFVLYLTFSSLCVSIINIFNKDTFKILLTFPFVVIGIKNIFSTNYKKSIIYFIISTLYMFVGELITSIVFSLLPFDYTFIINNILGKIIGVIVVMVFTLPLLAIKSLKNLVNKIESSIDEKSKIIITLILIVAIGALAYKNSTGTVNIINIIVNIVVTTTMILIIYMYYKENYKSQELSKNYNVMLNYLEKYEKELVEKRKIIHDYKNELIVIKGYIGDDKKLKEYVDEILKEQKNISENSIIRNIDKLPRGLKGLIYYKFSADSDVKVNLQVLNSLKKFDKIPSKLNKNVLTIIGVLIDNAIEAVEQEKEKYINIEFSINKNNFEMIMTNKCTKNFEIKNLMNIGYSTKGKNRGYGLVLVKDILKQEKSINLDISIENNEFISKLNVKI